MKVVLVLFVFMVVISVIESSIFERARKTRITRLENIIKSLNNRHESFIGQAIQDQIQLTRDSISGVRKGEDVSDGDDDRKDRRRRDVVKTTTDVESETVSNDEIEIGETSLAHRIQSLRQTIAELVHLDRAIGVEDTKELIGKRVRRLRAQFTQLLKRQAETERTRARRQRRQTETDSEAVTDA